MAVLFVTYLRRKHLKFCLVQPPGTTLTTHVVQSTQVHVRSDVKLWPIHVAGQLLHQNLSISVEHIHKILLYFEVESWSKQLAVGCPPLPCRKQYKLLVFTPDSKWQNSVYNKINRVYLTSLLGQLNRLTTTNQMMAT